MHAKTIFLNATEIESLEERDAYIREQCRGNDRLLLQVEALLVANDAPDSILDRLPIDFDSWQQWLYHNFFTN